MRRSGIALVTQHPDLRQALSRIGRCVVATEPGSVARSIETALSSGARAIGLVLGRLEEPATLGALADRARRAGKSIVALGVGMPPDHEAALRALARQRSIGVATSLDSLVDACVALATSGRPRGPRVAIVGAGTAVAGDLAALAGRRGLVLTMHGRSSGRALRSADVVGLVGNGARPPGAGGSKQTVVRAAIPVVDGPGTTKGVVLGGERLVEVLRILQALGRGHATKEASTSTARPAGIDPTAARAVLDGPARVLSEPSSKRALAPYGIVFPREVLSTSASMAEQAARTMRPPLTAKIASPDLLDKLDGKGIIRQISNGNRARAAYHALMRDALRARADARILGVLLSETVEGIAEVRIKAVRDPALGLLVRLGGTGICELTLPRDPVLLQPASRAEIADFVAGAPVSMLYDGSCSHERGDQRALVDTIVRLAAFSSDMADQVSEVVLAPVVVRAKGQGVVVTDARVSVSPR